MSGSTEFPVHESLDVVDGETIYATDEWHKAAVLYQYGASQQDSLELAIYLWHHEGNEWKRKQKYVVRTPEGWTEDKAAIKELLPALSDEPVSSGVTNPDETLPVSDYYHVAAGNTVFKTDDWWKAVVLIDAKGDYDTAEVILYVWQNTDGEWKLRQKYPIKRISDWEEDTARITKFLDRLEQDPGETSTAGGADLTNDPSSPENDEAVLKKAMENRHLSRQLVGTSD